MITAQAIVNAPEVGSDIGHIDFAGIDRGTAFRDGRGERLLA